MQKFRIVDARMGRGKTTAAIRYMQEHEETPFVYVTPYRSETEKVCIACGFDEPDSRSHSQQEEFRKLVGEGKSICITHSLFSRLSQDTLSMLRIGGYSLIIDESFDAIETIPARKSDIELLMKYIMTPDDSGLLTWDPTYSEYRGRFQGYKEYCEKRELYLYNGYLYRVLNPSLFERFREVYILTYEFMGSLLEAVLQLRGYDTRYQIIGIEYDEEGPYFSDEPDDPPPIDYFDLIHIIGDGWKDEEYGDWNFRCGKDSIFSTTWFYKKSRNQIDVALARKRLGQVMRMIPEARAKDRLWTSFKSDLPKFMDSSNRYLSSFAPINMRATNDFRGAYVVAYMANRYINPNVVKFLDAYGIQVNSTQYALTEMLQFIWRSRIRDGKEIYLYLPAKRMRTLLKRWMGRLAQGSAL